MDAGLRIWVAILTFWVGAITVILIAGAIISNLHSPYDPEAHYGNKRSVTWVGYKVHLTETCDEDDVHLITQVETTTAVLPDVEVGETIQQELAE